MSLGPCHGQLATHLHVLTSDPPLSPRFPIPDGGGSDYIPIPIWMVSCSKVSYRNSRTSLTVMFCRLPMNSPRGFQRSWNHARPPPRDQPSDPLRRDFLGNSSLVSFDIENSISRGFALQDTNLTRMECFEFTAA